MRELDTQEKCDGAQTNHILGAVLLGNVYCDFDTFLERARAQWGIVPGNLVRSRESLAFEVAGMKVTCCFVARPVPDNRAKRCCIYNAQWADAEQQIAGYQAHLLLSVTGCVSALAGYMLCTGLGSCWMQDSNAVAFLFPEQELLFEPQYFMEQASTIWDGEIPVELWISFGVYDGAIGNSAYTYGLEEFGKRELEIINSNQSQERLLDLLYDVVCYVIEDDVVLHDGDTIGFLEDQHLRISLSEGEVLEGETYKIDF